jgi:cell wall-associated NlpC family hydrolase
LKQFLYVSLLIALFTSCKPSSVIVTSKEKDSKSSANLSSRKTNRLIDKIVDSAEKNIGIKYKYAGTTKSGYDCSGLVYSTFGDFDNELPRGRASRYRVTRKLSAAGFC